MSTCIPVLKSLDIDTLERLSQQIIQELVNRAKSTATKQIATETQESSNLSSSLSSSKVLSTDLIHIKDRNHLEGAICGEASKGDSQFIGNDISPELISRGVRTLNVGAIRYVKLSKIFFTYDLVAMDPSMLDLMNSSCVTGEVIQRNTDSVVMKLHGLPIHLRLNYTRVKECIRSMEQSITDCKYWFTEELLMKMSDSTLMADRLKYNTIICILMESPFFITADEWQQLDRSAYGDSQRSKRRVTSSSTSEPSVSYRDIQAYPTAVDEFHGPTSIATKTVNASTNGSFHNVQNSNNNNRNNNTSNNNTSRLVTPINSSSRSSRSSQESTTFLSSLAPVTPAVAVKKPIVITPNHDIISFTLNNSSNSQTTQQQQSVASPTKTRNSDSSSHKNDSSGEATKQSTGLAAPIANGVFSNNESYHTRSGRSFTTPLTATMSIRNVNYSDTNQKKRSAPVASKAEMEIWENENLYGKKYKQRDRTVSVMDRRTHIDFPSKAGKRDDIKSDDNNDDGEDGSDGVESGDEGSLQSVDDAQVMVLSTKGKYSNE